MSTVSETPLSVSPVKGVGEYGETRKMSRRHGVANVLQGLTDSQIQSLRQIWRQRYGEELETSLAAGKPPDKDKVAGDDTIKNEAAAQPERDSEGLEIISPEQIMAELESEMAGLSLAPLRRRRNAVCYDPGEHSLINELLKRLQLDHEQPVDR